MILNFKNKLVWIMMSSVFYLFFLKALYKLNFEVLDF